MQRGLRDGLRLKIISDVDCIRICRRNNGLSLEQTAEENLNYLIDRHLVIVDERKPDGTAKICSMNYLLYDFCKTEAGNERENFLQELKKSTADGVFHPPVNEVEKYRRVGIHADISRFISRFLSLRSHSLTPPFICFSL